MSGLDLLKDPRVICLFWGLVLVLLVLVLLKVRERPAKPAVAAERFENEKAPLAFDGGGRNRYAQDNSVPYLTRDFQFMDEIKAEERRKLEKEAADAAAEAAKDQAALQGQGGQVGGDAVAKKPEQLSGSRGEASVTGFEPRYIYATEKLTTGREAPQMWMIGDDVDELKHEVAGQSPDLSPNRWTLQLQNQVSDINSDSIEGKLNEDTLFQRRLANM